MSERAEIAALGAALLTSTAHTEVVDRLRPEMFTRNAHRTVFEALKALADRGVRADTVSLLDQLGDRIDEIGGAAALAGIPSAAPNPAQAGEYCRMVEAAWRGRTVAESAERLAKAARGGDDDLDLLIDQTVELWTSTGTSDGILSVDDIAPALIERLAGTEAIPSWSTGWSVVDRVFRLPRGLMTLVTGIPGSGKSTWVDCMVWNILKANQDVKVAWFSPEQAPADKHALNLIHTAIGVDPIGADGELVNRGLSWIDGRMTWLDDQRENTVSGILSRARLVKRRQGLDILVVDPWNKIRHKRGGHSREDLYIQEALGQFSRFARKEQVAVVIVAHPKTLEPEPGYRTRIKAPTAYSISGGAEWDNQGDAIVAVHRDKHGEKCRPSLVEVIVQKVRDDGRFGTVGAVELEFDQRARRYGPLGYVREVA